MMVFLDLQLPKVNSKKLLLTLLCAGGLTFVGSLPAAAQYGAKPTQSHTDSLRERIRALHESRRKSPQGNEPLFYLNGQYTGNNPYLKTQLDLETQFGKAISEGYGYSENVEPSFPETKFYKFDDPATLNGRVDALLHGITVSLPPEHDMYGYEIRRYMSEIAGPEVLGDKKRLADEIANTKRAKIILEYWGKNLTEKMKKIEGEIEADDSVPSSTRSNFKFKSGKAKAFLVEANSWVDNNQQMLEMLYSISDRYQYIEPSLNFADRGELERFANLFRARQKAMEIIHAYPPFRMMVY